MESLAEIMARVEQLAFAREEERNALLLPPQLPIEQASLALDLPVAPLLPQPEYIQAEAFLERSYWIPGSYAPLVSEKRNSFLKLLKNKAFKKERRTKNGGYAIGECTTLESNKSQE